MSVLGKLKALNQLLERRCFSRRCVYSSMELHPDHSVRAKMTQLCCLYSCGCQDRHCSLCYVLSIACECLWENISGLQNGWTWGQGTTAVSHRSSQDGRTNLVLRICTASAAANQDEDPFQVLGISSCLPLLTYTKFLRHAIL